ncbi:DUF305 domain-containing protein [Actinomycetospora soli]|uniref:DUF305 domain-containing protein n=1 Tax=Actinomycetospora soli TaxID=2893887 RepID=UPI001E4EEDCE|nr:DUF305 domain-containing protein [Actinomycetospora soli]MCD2191111.1 DUF305 domain-containing protein [Actinomycetospora soli]
MTVAAVAAGCSSTAPTTTPSALPSTPTAAQGTAPVSAEHNAADVMFAQQMIPHHTQAIAMSQLAPTRAASPEIKELATKIEGAQAPELDQMNAMLAAWGAPAPPAGSTSMPGMPGMTGMPMGGTSMPGMMSDGQMQQLSAQSGAAFDRAFLDMMIQHHTGAIQMAQTELAQGQNPQAKQLAQAIIADQQSEILQMQTLLGRV